MKKSYRKPSRHRRVLSIFAQFRLLILDQLNDKLRERLLRRRLGLNMLQKTSLSINFTQNIKITSTPNKRLHFRNIFFPRRALTFLWCFCIHSRTLSKPWRDSGDWKKSTLGLPSFFGPRFILSSADFNCFNSSFHSEKISKIMMRLNFSNSPLFALV